MNPQLNSVVDVVLDRSPEELIASVLVALVLALALSGLFLLLRRKVSDVSTLVICLAPGSNLVAMTVAGAYVRYRLTSGRRLTREPGPAMARFPGSGFGGYRGMFMANRILETADVNNDGFLSVDEAASAAAQFVSEADEAGEGRLTEEGLRDALRTRLSPTHPGMPPPRMGGLPSQDGPAPAPGPGPAPDRANRDVGGRHHRESRDRS